jgi:hypothetical protein
LVLIIRAEASNVAFPFAIKAFVFIAEFSLLIFTKLDEVPFHMDRVGVQA